METIPLKCQNVNTVSSFCNCIAAAETVDPAARGFCDRAIAGNYESVTGDDLTELKKALKDLES